MARPYSNKCLQRRNRLTAFESLEPRRVLDCYGFDSVEVCVPGDSNVDGEFNTQDLVHVMQAGKYGSDTPADWGDGDWNRDGIFDQADLVAVFQAGTYLQGAVIDDLTSLIADLPAHPGAFAPPITITNNNQLAASIDDRAAVEAIARATDFNRQTLLLFSWSGSGGDHLVAEPTFVDGAVNIKLRFQFGLTDDLRQHLGLLAIPKEADWNINIEERVVHEDTSEYEFGDPSQLVVSGGIAGIRDEYRIEGSFLLTRKADGSASFSQVEATLHGSGMSSLDGQPLDSVLNLSGLTGLQIGDSSVVFSGVPSSGYGVIQLTLHVGSDSLTMSGRDFPPCCDFFQHEINAKAWAE